MFQDFINIDEMTATVRSMKNKVIGLLAMFCLLCQSVDMIFYLPKVG